MSFNKKIKGWFGEAIVSIAKNIYLDSEIYISINNVTIRTTNGTTQIDHVIVSKYGIFVIETKNMEGWIFGGENQPKWTQSFRNSKFQFQNPLHQNYRHIKALEEITGLPNEYFHSVVCFVGETCELKTKLPSNVVNGGLFKYIKSKTDLIIPEYKVSRIVDCIKTGMIQKNILGFTTSETKREHIESLSQRYSSVTNCPKCNSELVSRTVKSGSNAGKEFLGCSKFPTCRYIKSD
jgi:hypothetical protein